MQTFQCDVCDQLIFFENNSCMRCGHMLGYSMEGGEMLSLKPAAHASGTSTAPDIYRSVSEPDDAPGYRLCANTTKYNACNWLIPARDSHEYCLSCRLTEVTPPLQDETRRKQWVRVEAAKRRLVYTLLDLGLPVPTRVEDPELGLTFRFEESTKQHQVLTGHASGVITLNMAEANAAFREHAREKMGEVYRTLLGHLRHECGHYYWELLVLPSEKWLPRFREVFGDEQVSYQDAMTAHYANGAPANWSDNFISAYATMHPWEDWAETWAHYLHMVDTLETAESYELVVRSPSPRGKSRRARPSLEHRQNFNKLFDGWYSLTFVLNGLSRSMGMPDSYPFAISEKVKAKLQLVHDIVNDLAANAVGETAA